MSTFPQTPGFTGFAALTPLTTAAAEFPRIDDRFTGRGNRWGWMLKMDFKRFGLQGNWGNADEIGLAA